MKKPLKKCPWCGAPATLRMVSKFFKVYNTPTPYDEHGVTPEGKPTFYIRQPDKRVEYYEVACSNPNCAVHPVLSHMWSEAEARQAWNVRKGEA